WSGAMRRSVPRIAHAGAGDHQKPIHITARKSDSVSRFALTAGSTSGCGLEFRPAGFPAFAICRGIFPEAGGKGWRARLKSFAVQDVGRLAPCVKEQGETPFDCGPNQGEYWGFAGLNCS